MFWTLAELKAFRQSAFKDISMIIQNFKLNFKDITKSMMNLVSAITLLLMLIRPSACILVFTCYLKTPLLPMHSPSHWYFNSNPSWTFLQQKKPRPAKQTWARTIQVALVSDAVEASKRSWKRTPFRLHQPTRTNNRTKGMKDYLQCSHSQ